MPVRHGLILLTLLFSHNFNHRSCFREEEKIKQAHYNSSLQEYHIIRIGTNFLSTAVFCIVFY